MTRSSTASMLLLIIAGCSQEVQFGEVLDEVPIPRERPQPVVEQTDFVTQARPPVADVLFVVDNSCSMEDNQDSLKENFPRFMRFFEGSGIDYHIGVVSTDTELGAEAGVLQASESGLRFITPEVPNASEEFATMAQLGPDGSARERGLEAAYVMLELKVDEPANAGFYRQDAALHVVFVSDEDDSSRESITTPDEWINWFGGLKIDPDPSLRSVSSVVCFPGICDDIVPGTRYLQLTQAIGGLSRNIQDPDWADVLEHLGGQTSGREFFLTQTPVVDSIEVSLLRSELGGEPVEIGVEPAVFDDSVDPPVLVSGAWTYEARRNSITFEALVPEPLDVVKINYVLLSATQGGGLDETLDLE